jgi:hypothetical protein
MSSIEVVYPQPGPRPLHLLEPRERLPSQQARARFEALEQRSQDALTLFRAVADELREARADLHVAEARRKALMMPKAAGGHGLAADDGSVVDIDRTIANLRGKVDRLSELAQDRSARSGRIGAVLRTCEDFLKRGGVPGGVKIGAAPSVSVKDVLRRGESPRAALDRLRLRGREIAAEMHREKSRPYPASGAKEKARAALAARARPPIVSGMIEHNADLQWPKVMSRLGLAAIAGAERGMVHGDAMGEVEDTIGLICWLMAGPMAAEIDKLIEAEADDENAATAEEREVRLAELERERLAIERQEAAIVWSMQEAGEAVEHRDDISPLAVLGLELVTVA